MFPLARSVGWLGLLAIAFGLLCPPLIRESAGQRSAGQKNATQRTRKKDQKTTADEVLKNKKGQITPTAALAAGKGSVKVRVTVRKVVQGYLSRYPLWICVGEKKQQVTKEGTYIFNDLKPGTSIAYFQAAACWILTPGGWHPEKVTIRANKTTTLHLQADVGFLGCG